jgi:Polysaccharide lyase family 4, domain II
MMWRSVLIAAALMGTSGLLATPARAYEVETVSNGGTIQGRVTFTGPPPAPRKEVRTKNPEVCGSGVFEVPRMALGADKAVGESVVYLKGIEKGEAWPKLPKPPELVNHKCDFVPHVQAMPLSVGEIVIVNSDPILHNTHGYYGRLTAFNVGLPTQGMRIPKPLTKPGIVKVDCDAHGWMLGWVYVADNPYYAVTAKDGTFTIKNVPPGSYTLVAWQEFTGPVEVPVTVKPKAVESVNVDLAKK